MLEGISRRVEWCLKVFGGVLNELLNDVDRSER